MSTGTSSPGALLDMALSYRKAKTLLTAVEIGVFSMLAEKALGPQALADCLDLNARGALDFFDALVALGLLERDDAGNYANTPTTARYLDRAKPHYIGDPLHRASRWAYANWSNLATALRTGKPQSGNFGTDGFGALYQDPAALEQFLRAMSGSSLMLADALANGFDWSPYKTVLDIGAAEGCVLSRVAAAHPHIGGSGYDLPQVETHFLRFVAHNNLSGRLRFHAGDFHRDPFPRADVIVLGRVLHNWDVLTKLMLLRKAHAALSHGGAVVVCESLIDEGRRTNADALLASLHMLIETPGGHEATGANYVGWLTEAGFSEVRVLDLACAQSAVVGFKC